MVEERHLTHFMIGLCFIPNWEKNFNLMGKDTAKITHPDTCIENVFTAPYSLCIFVSQLRSVKKHLPEAALPLRK